MWFRPLDLCGVVGRAHSLRQASGVHCTVDLGSRELAERVTVGPYRGTCTHGRTVFRQTRSPHRARRGQLLWSETSAQ